VDQDLVFLDTLRDAYFCVPDGGSHADLQAAGRAIRLNGDDLLSDLRQAGLISRSRPEGVRPDPAEAIRPSASAVRSTYEAPRLGDVIDALVAMADLALHYRGRRFSEILESAAQGRSPTTVCDSRVFALADRFHRWIPYAPVSGKCLIRSFMLLRFLRRHGGDARWVFGVSTWPFRAHCWLQCGDTALDDHPDRLAAYTALLVL
jgi:hypothetical protein